MICSPIEKLTDEQLESRIRYHEAGALGFRAVQEKSWAQREMELAEPYRAELERRQEVAGAHV